jgi:hypothetical protein
MAAHASAERRSSLARSPEGKRRSASVGTGQSAERRSDLISRAAPCQQLSAPCLCGCISLSKCGEGEQHGASGAQAWRGRLLTAAPRDLQLRAQQRKSSRCAAASCLCRRRGRRQIAACSSPSRISWRERAWRMSGGRRASGHGCTARERRLVHPPAPSEPGDPLRSLDAPALPLARSPHVRLYVTAMLAWEQRIVAPCLQPAEAPARWPDGRTTPALSPATDGQTR